MSAVYAPLIRGEQQAEWEEYASKNQGWIAESARLKKVHPSHRDALHGTIQDHEHDRRRLQQEDIPPISEFVFHWENGTQAKEVATPGQVLAPLWQGSPAESSAVNVNLLSDKRIEILYNTMREVKQTVLSANTEIGDMFDWLFDPEEKTQKVLPHGFIAEPVYSDFVEEPEMVGILLGITVYTNLFDRLLPQGAAGIVAVVKDSCGNVMSFGLNDRKAHFLGLEDLHDPTFDGHMRHFPLEISYQSIENVTDNLCVHEVFVYPGNELRDAHDNNKPLIYTSIVAASFAITMLVLLAYDQMVARRQEKTMQTAIRSDRVVSSLFPETVRDRLLQQSTQKAKDKHNPQAFLNDEELDRKSARKSDSPPIADLFPEVTVMVSKLFRDSYHRRQKFFSHNLSFFSLQTLLALPLGHQHVSRSRSSCYWKLSTAHSMRLPASVGSSRLRQWVTVMLLLRVFRLRAMTMLLRWLVLPAIVIRRCAKSCGNWKGNWDQEREDLRFELDFIVALLLEAFCAVKRLDSNCLGIP